MHLRGGLATWFGQFEVLDAFSVEGAWLGGFGLADERDGDVLETSEVTVDLEFSGVVFDEVHWELAAGFWFGAGVEVGFEGSRGDLAFLRGGVATARLDGLFVLVLNCSELFSAEGGHDSRHGIVYSKSLWILLLLLFCWV